MGIENIRIVNKNGLSNYDLEAIIENYNINIPIKVSAMNELDKSYTGGIVNYQDTDETGTHWVAYAIKGKEFLYFDSFGMPPPKEIIKFANNIRISMNDGQLQDINSVLCGWYCVHFLIHILGLGWKYSKYLSEFNPDDQMENEKLISDFFKLKYI